MIALRRLGVAGLLVEQAQTLDDLVKVSGPADRRSCLGAIGDALITFQRANCQSTRRFTFVVVRASGQVISQLKETSVCILLALVFWAWGLSVHRERLRRKGWFLRESKLAEFLEEIEA